MAAALGANLPVTHPVGSMVVDIGGGSTEVGVVSLAGLHMSLSARVGGDRMDEAITSFVRRKHNLLIGEATAERIKIEAGSALVTSDQATSQVRVGGREVVRGVPLEIRVEQRDICTALAEPVSQIVETVRQALEHTAPEIAADIMETGIVMTGGGSLLRNIDVVLAENTGLPVRVAHDAMNCVALGAGKALEDMSYRGVLHAV